MDVAEFAEEWVVLWHVSDWFIDGLETWSLML